MCEHGLSVQRLEFILRLMVDICDDQRCCVLPLITDAWAKEREDPLWEQAPSEGVDVRPVLHVKKWHSPLLVICKHSDNLRLLLEAKMHRGRIQGAILISAPEPHRPVAVLRLGGDHPLPVHGLFDHPQVPEGLRSHCNLVDDARKHEKLII